MSMACRWSSASPQGRPASMRLPRSRWKADRAEAVIADRGYDADILIAQSEKRGAHAVIPPTRNRKQQRAYDR